MGPSLSLININNLFKSNKKGEFFLFKADMTNIFVNTKSECELYAIANKILATKEV